MPVSVRMLALCLAAGLPSPQWPHQAGIVGVAVVCSARHFSARSARSPFLATVRHQAGPRGWCWLLIQLMKVSLSCSATTPESRTTCSATERDEGDEGDEGLGSPVR